MSIDIAALVIDPVFERLGSPCTLTHPTTGASITVSVIDAVDGVMIGDIPVSSTKPAICVRQSELNAYGFWSNQLIDSDCVYRGHTYRIRDASENPAPNVGRDALVNLIIVEP
jgi:hypothetical protein